jgi:hypothetical protein
MQGHLLSLDYLFIYTGITAVRGIGPFAVRKVQYEYIG